MAQTRRVGKRNKGRTDQKRRGFRPTVVGKINFQRVACMAQTRRMEKRNKKGVPTKSAEVFALP